MSHCPHPDTDPTVVSCAIITVSDTRTPETDRSGQLIRALLEAEGHAIATYTIVPDEPASIHTALETLTQRSDLAVFIFNGGTGIAPRDTTYDAIEHHLEKNLPGFGEVFRALSYQEIGSRAIASRAIAGVYHNKLIFSIPGSTHAVRLAMEKLIVPELRHLVQQLNS